LRWIAILHAQITADLAASGGVHTAHDVVRLLLAGADVTMLASALLLHGVGRLQRIETDLLAWLEEHEYESVAPLDGSMSNAVSPTPRLLNALNTSVRLERFRSRHLARD
jgi:dihydroorotate dehydrogenase (fumarate)